MNSFTWLFLLALAVGFGLQLWLNLRHARHVATHRHSVPPAFSGRITLEEHRKAADYTQAKSRLARVDLALEYAVLLGFTLGGGLQALHEALARWIAAPLWQGVALIVAFSLIGGAIQLPLSWYRTFRLEQRFGFNKMTQRLFWIDLVKKTLLAFVLEAPFVALVLWLFDAMGEQWWLWTWGALMALQLVMYIVAPTWIAPLFNKFTPLSDDALKQRIGALLERCGFKASGVFVMDGSTRSSHGNAYFTGFGRTKRIVFFDTLLEHLTPPEIEAVLAHELGHYHHGHIKKRLALMAVLSLAGLWLLSVLIEAPWFYRGLGVEAQTPALALLLFAQALPVFMLPIVPLFNILSRKDEFEADRFAARQAQSADLISALVKLYRDNAATVTPEPLHSAFYDSHPPAPIRIAALARQH